MHKNMSTLIQHELQYPAHARSTIVSIGMFDGLHMGHQALIRRLTEQAHAMHAISTVITFKQHPSTLLTPSDAVPMLTSLNERICLLKAMAVDVVIPLTFSQELATLGAQPFVLMLQRYLKMQGMILGWDFALGHRREGSLETLCEMGQLLGFSTEAVGPVKYHHNIVSSTAIRQALLAGDICAANAMLTRPFRIESTVVGGDKRGTKLGFPTANFSVTSQQALPADGIYATIATIEGQPHSAATFIGTRPTFNGAARSIETHLLDFSGNLYNHNLKIDIIERLREAVKFNDIQALKAQIALDISQIRQILSGYDCCGIMKRVS